MSIIQICVWSVLLGVVSAIYTNRDHGNYNTPYRGPDGFQRVSAGFVAPYSNENRQLAVNLAALSVGSGTGTGLFYGVPGTGLNLENSRPGHGAKTHGHIDKYKNSHNTNRYGYKEGGHVTINVRGSHAPKATVEPRHGYEGGKQQYGHRYSYGDKKYSYGASNGRSSGYGHQNGGYKPQTSYGGGIHYGYRKNYGYETYDLRPGYSSGHKAGYRPTVKYYKPIYTKSHLFY